MSVIETKLKILPNKPGVYMYHDQNGTIIYVGKAKSLKNRVRSYFSGKSADPKTQVLVSKIADLEWIITDSEVEALLLENNLIKQYAPRYNVMLKDDKSYPYICISNEPFPRVFKTRNVVRDGSKYYGPYTDNSHLNRLLKAIYKIFTIRTCRRKIQDGGNPGDEPCLQYHLGNCQAPCIGGISQADYSKIIDEIIRFLNGNTRPVIQRLTDEMEQASGNMEFELAARGGAGAALQFLEEADHAFRIDARVGQGAQGHAVGLAFVHARVVEGVLRGPGDTGGGDCRAELRVDRPEQDAGDEAGDRGHAVARLRGYPLRDVALTRVGQLVRDHAGQLALVLGGEHQPGKHRNVAPRHREGVDGRVVDHHQAGRERGPGGRGDQPDAEIAQVGLEQRIRDDPAALTQLGEYLGPDASLLVRGKHGVHRVAEVRQGLARGEDRLGRQEAQEQQNDSGHAVRGMLGM